MDNLSQLWAQTQEIGWSILMSAFNSEQLIATLSRPELTVAAFVVLTLVIFTETGLLIGFFLPGDSLLVTVGLVLASPACGWNLPLLLVLLSTAAIVGDSVGYSIGFKSGPRIFNREQSWFFNKHHLLKAQAFYEKHGGKTIVLARFMPIIRTFAPVVAGVGKMDYKRFLFFNVLGGIGWVFSMILTGYFLPALLNPVLQNVLGNPDFRVERHVEKVIVVVVLLSISPGIVAWLRSRWSQPATCPANDANSSQSAKAKPSITSPGRLSA